MSEQNLPYSQTVIYEEHIAFEKPDNENIKIWRYLDFTKFVSLLDKQALFFARADKLGDPFEGSYSKANIQLRPTFYKEMPEPILKQMPSIFRQFIKFTFINCWHVNEYESDAMWKLYLMSEEGVAIQSTFKRLTECFENDSEVKVHIGKVSYIDYDIDWLPEGNTFYPFLHKRKSFEHENELRAMFMKASYKDDGSLYLWDESVDGLYVPVDLDILIEVVSVSPTADEWFTDLVKSILNKYDLKKEVIPSSLSEGPVY